MKVLFLGNIGSPLIQILKDFKEDVVVCSNKIDKPYLQKIKPEFIVSYGYPYIVKEEIIDLYDGKLINLHISFLPWNRGSDPNLWSLVDNTPKGVTIHYMDAGIDTGDIIVQAEVECKSDDLLGDYYNRLHDSIRQLFKENWLAIKTGTCARNLQSGAGSHHKAVEKEQITHLLHLGEKTPTSSLISVS